LDSKGKKTTLISLKEEEEGVEGDTEEEAVLEKAEEGTRVTEERFNRIWT